MGNYFQIKQSWSVKGWHKWYWFLHQESGHIYHISNGWDTLEECLKDLKDNGPIWYQDLTN